MESVATCTPPTSSCSTIIYQLLHNVHSRKDLIKELLADNDFHCEIVESLDSIKPPILIQASYYNSIFNWKDTARCYPVYKKCSVFMVMEQELDTHNQVVNLPLKQRVMPSAR